MTKKLPQPKKTLKSFILEEDAKIIDRTAINIAVAMASMVIGLTDVFAGGGSAPTHNNHSNHANNVYHEGDYTKNTGSAVQDETLGNEGDTPVTESYAGGFNVEPKQVASAHSNHYNHSNGMGGSGGK